MRNLLKSFLMFLKYLHPWAGLVWLKPHQRPFLLPSPLSPTPTFYLVGVLYPSAVLSEGQCPWGEQTPWLLPLPASRICLSWCFPLANFCNTCLHACPIIKCSGVWEQEPLWVLYHSIASGPRLPPNKFQNAQNSLLDRINDFFFCYCVHPVFRIPFFFLLSINLQDLLQYYHTTSVYF